MEAVSAHLSGVSWAWGIARRKTVDEESVVTVAEAAVILERSTEQVRRYLREGRLTGKRMGNQWFIDRVAVSAFLQDLREERGFLDRLKPASEIDPLGAVIAIGDGRGSNIAEGKEAYRAASRWGR
jgi:excisionase family DNA binding protein